MFSYLTPRFTPPKRHTVLNNLFFFTVSWRIFASHGHSGHEGEVSITGEVRVVHFGWLPVGFSRGFKIKL